MNFFFSRPAALAVIGLAVSLLLPSCAVQEEGANLSVNSASASAARKPGEEAVPSTWSERMAAAREEREKAREAAEKAREQALAEKRKEEEAAARLAAAEAKKAEAARIREEAAAARLAAAEAKRAEAEQQALAEREAREREERRAAAEQAREERLAERRRAVEERREARLAATRLAEEARQARRAEREQEVAAVAVADREGGRGLFSRILISAPTHHPYSSPGHHVHVDQALLPTLGPSNSRIEISISEQRLRVYRTGGGSQDLVIETQVSTGKPGHATPRGSYRISEKQVYKRSTLYGSWHAASGAQVGGSNRVSQRPRGAVRFVGAEMPYWLRINGGIGIHVGFVPDGPASHGCIRVPESVQPLIFSKVGIGTPVVVR